MTRTIIIYTIHTVLLACFVLAPAPAVAAEPIHHALRVVLNPIGHRLEVFDTVTLPTERIPADRRVQFELHAGLNAIAAMSGVTLKRVKAGPSDAPDGGGPELDRYEVRLRPGKNHFVVKYQGKIHHALGEGDTPGLIGPDGVVLSGASAWYPQFRPDDLVTFRIDTHLPAGWSAVSQGARTFQDTGGGKRWPIWESTAPQDEIFLIAAKFTEYSRPAAEGIEAQAFLRAPDAKLAETYLAVTGQYLEMYQRLIGAYPYPKFALVENFWETGYGMPSFTLLGSSVLRLPFILHSSYPHEILHNWWGNGVLVDYARGNWSEGLTAYLADHLIQEQRGAGAEFRRAALQKYADSVSAARDFPLAEFRMRHSPATEAVGYGKTLMLFHMLRLRLGDAAFIQALRKLYADQRFKRAAWSDVQAAFAAHAPENVAPLFDQWITRPGAPTLTLFDAAAVPADGGYRLTATIEQIQAGPPYRLLLPIAVHLEGHAEAFQTRAPMDDRKLDLALDLPARPVRIELDPEFDLFRRLDREEIPPALTQPLGSDRTLIVLPAAAPEPVLEAYKKFAAALAPALGGEVGVTTDAELAAPPTDRSVWLLGWENRFRPELAPAVAALGGALEADATQLGGATVARADHAVVLTTRDPDNPNTAVTFVAADRAAALPGLARKLPHYGKYSYLVFEGDAPTNTIKGRWTVARSPLSVVVHQADGAPAGDERGRLAPRHALAELPPPADAAAPVPAAP